MERGDYKNAFMLVAKTLGAACQMNSPTLKLEAVKRAQNILLASKVKFSCKIDESLASGRVTHHYWIH
jgi:hypothetical protein